MEEKKKGGKRDNAGRKPSDDPKMPITVYVKESVIQKNGGKIELARRIIDAVDADFVTNPIMDRIEENNKPKSKAKILSERNAERQSKQSQINPIERGQVVEVDILATSPPERKDFEDNWAYLEAKAEWKKTHNL